MSMNNAPTEEAVVEMELDAAAIEQMEQEAPAAAANPLPTSPVARLFNHPGMWYILCYFVLMVAVNPVLLVFAILKYHNKEKNAFRVHPVLANMYVVALIIASFMAMILDIINNHLGGRIQERHNMVLKRVVCLLCVLATIFLGLLVMLPTH